MLREKEISGFSGIASRIYYGGKFAPFICFYLPIQENSTIYNIDTQSFEIIPNGCIMHYIHETAREISRNEMWDILKKGK